MWILRPWSHKITYNGSDLRTSPNEQCSKEVSNYNQTKLQLNNIYGPRRLPAPRLGPAKSPKHTHQSPAGVPRFRALRGPRRQDVQNALLTEQRVGRRGPHSLLDYRLTLTRTDYSLTLTTLSFSARSLSLIYPATLSGRRQMATLPGESHKRRRCDTTGSYAYANRFIRSQKRIARDPNVLNATSPTALSNNSKIEKKD